jgi:hypothetical protein
MLRLFIYSLLNDDLDTMFTDSEKKQFSKNSLYLIEKLKISLEKRFSYLFC